MRISVFDVGGTWIKHALFDGQSLGETAYIATEAHLGTEQMIAKLAEIIRQEAADQPLDAVGISTRGQVNPSSGTILYDPPEIFPDYTGTCLPKRLQQLLNMPDLPIFVENDANCAVLAESRFGAAKEFSDCIMLTFGTGIGGGILLNHNIYHGSQFSAGEFGMMYFPDETGRPVFWETLASGQVLSESPNLWTDRISQGIASLIHIFNPPWVILGGGLMEDKERCLAVCKKVSSLLAPGFEKVNITRAQLGNHAGMLGAGCLAMENITSQKSLY